MTHRRLVLLLTAAATALLAPLGFAATSAPDYTKLIVKYGKQSVQATLGSHCIPLPDGSGECIEVKDYPLQGAAKVTVARGGEVTVLLGAPAGKVSWRTARVSSGTEVATAIGAAKLATKTKKRWKIILPKNLRRSSTVMGFDVEYSNAYASFEVTIKVK